MTFALEVRALKAGYGAFPVLHNVSLNIPAGEIAALLGANGAGKTTTLRAICGMIPSRGIRRLEGKDVGRVRASRLVRLGVAHVPEGRGTFPNMTVVENLRIGAVSRRGRGEIDSDISAWLEMFPQLRDRLEERAGYLSGGEQQMLAISRAMMSRPKLLLLDEPSTGLAPRIIESLFDQLAEINRQFGTAMLIVEQNADLALKLAGSAFVLDAGETTLSGRASDLLQDDRVRRAYLQA